MENNNISLETNNLPKELFKKSKIDAETLHDQAFETKPISFLKGALMRFAKNKASIVASIIIAVIILYAIIVPFASPKAHVNTTDYPTGFYDANFSYALPYNPMFKGSGFWDGTEVKTGQTEDDYEKYKLTDSNHQPLVAVTSIKEDKVGSSSIKMYSLRIDSYAIGNKVVYVSQSQSDKLVSYEKEQGIYKTKNSIMKPLVDVAATFLNIKIKWRKTLPIRAMLNLQPPRLR